MTPAPDTTLAISARLAQLEARCRRAQLLSMTCILTCATLVSLAWTSAPAAGISRDKVEARQFALIDAEGKPRGDWTSTAGETSLTLRDAAGKARIVTFVKQGEAFVVLRDGKENTRLGISVDGAGTPHAVLMDKSQTPRLHLTLDAAASNGSIQMIDPKGYTPVGLGMMPDGKPWLRPSENYTGGDWGRDLSKKRDK